MGKSIENFKVTISVGVFITVILFIIFQAANISSWTTDMENQHEQFTKADLYFNDKLEDLEEKQNAIAISNAKIETKLENIESLLTEIKDDLKTK